MIPVVLEGRDPYAAASRLGTVANAFYRNEGWWLSVPAFAGATKDLNAQFSDVHLVAIKISSASLAKHEEGDVMERRHFLKIAFGVAAGAAALAASVQAAPLLPHPLTENGRLPPANEDPRPALTTEDEVDRLKPEEVRWGRRWGHRRHWGWRRRHWGWRRRDWGWRRRHWGWHRRRWHRRYWRRRYW